ncbi:SHOCT domain-containing protein [Mobilitalea sibirica]|uniref:SHOCT domain-containing protein n=1 Tax=Mobilitalea sibirica TaxID=1462919 RepID=A0A8J7H0U8_9FIRM|nr:SHOCT domain-containing protein [Mobilitalea sibirica]MBH1939838.1 SHOCT domain-containing protein [Mobilitalea sibirica]
MMIFFWILLIIILYYIFNDNERINITRRQDTSAVDVLKMRYVNGEIDEETFIRMKKTIR